MSEARPLARHVLVIPSWYPSEYNPANGGFFRDQCLALQSAGVRVGVIYPELRSLRSFSPKSLIANHFQTAWHDDEGISTLRFQGWNVPGRLQPALWRRQALRLFDRYVERCGRPDLVHAHGAQAAGLAASLIERAHARTLGSERRFLRLAGVVASPGLAADSSST